MYNNKMVRVHFKDYTPKEQMIDVWCMEEVIKKEAIRLKNDGMENNKIEEIILRAFTKILFDWGISRLTTVEDDGIGEANNG